MGTDFGLSDGGQDKWWLLSRLSPEAIDNGLWLILIQTWECLPVADRAQLRYRFYVKDVPGLRARVGIPLDVQRIEIELGRDMLAGELPHAFAHELAHVYLGHVDLDAASRKPVARVLPGELSEAQVAILLTAGFTARAWTDTEIQQEADADAQAHAWGFPRPGGVTE